MKRIFRIKTYHYIFVLLAAAALAVGNVFWQKSEFVKAESVQVDCSGSWASPTSVDEASLAGDDVTFADAGEDGYCVLDNSVSANTVTINSGAVITHADEDADGVNITTVGALTVNGQINAFARGCKSTSSSSNGYGPNGSNVCTSATAGYGDGSDSAGGMQGGGHGGSAGLGSAASVNAGGVTYGSATASVLFGSSGGSYSTQAIGGTGGGFIIPDVGGTLTLGAGSYVSANGAQGGTYSTDSAGGGGSGGSSNTS